MMKIGSMNTKTAFEILFRNNYSDLDILLSRGTQAE